MNTSTCYSSNYFLSFVPELCYHFSPKNFPPLPFIFSLLPLSLEMGGRLNMWFPLIQKAASFFLYFLPLQSLGLPNLAIFVGGSNSGRFLCDLFFTRGCYSRCRPKAKKCTEKKNPEKSLTTAKHASSQQGRNLRKKIMLFGERKPCNKKDKWGWVSKKEINFSRISNDSVEKKDTVSLYLVIKETKRGKAIKSRVVEWQFFVFLSSFS